MLAQGTNPPQPSHPSETGVSVIEPEI